MKTKDSDMLTGTIWKALLAFFFPILIGTFFQQLYNTVDAIIVGRFAGVTALSSVGGSSAIIINLVVGFFTGLSSGCTVVISQFYGAGDTNKLKKALHTTYAFGLIGGVIFGIIGIYFTPYVLKLMGTPEETLASSALYVRIYFAGLIFVFIYNLGSAVLRALGDSTRPLVYLIICTLVNIVFDLIFVIVFNLNVLGVALATLMAQAISAILVTEYLMHRLPMVKLNLREIAVTPDIFKKMIFIGLPSGIQSSTYSLSNMFIQSAINSFALNTVAGWTAEGKVDVIFWMINGSFGIACATFVGQNYGARNFCRIKKGVKTVLTMSLTSAIIISFLMYNWGGKVLWLFSTDPEVVSIGAHMMQIIVPGYFTFVFLEIFSSALKAMGDTLLPTIINLTCIVAFRVIWIFIYGKCGNLDMVLYCYPISWVLCSILMSTYYLIRRKKLIVHNITA